MKTFQTIAEYNEAKMMLTEYEKAFDEYRKTHKGGVPVNVCAAFPFADRVSNDLRSAIEVWEFCNEIPEKYFLYISETRKEATTWTGQKLGSVSFGNSFRSNMGDERVPISVNAINGKLYHGTFFKSAGDYARIKIAHS